MDPLVRINCFSIIHHAWYITRYIIPFAFGAIYSKQTHCTAPILEIPFARDDLACIDCDIHQSHSLWGLRAIYKNLGAIPKYHGSIYKYLRAIYKYLRAIYKYLKAIPKYHGSICKNLRAIPKYHGSIYKYLRIIPWLFLNIMDLFKYI